jgi:hypothetical protein
MTYPRKAEDRDSVLFAFHQECERPTAEQIIAWTKRFPEFADDIRAHAAVAWDWAMRDGLPAEQLDRSLAAKGYSKALNLIFDEEHSVQNITTACQSFQEMLAAAGKNVPDVARELKIARSVVADLVNGWMVEPIPKRLSNALLSSLRTTPEVFHSAIHLAQESPLVGHAKADRAPTVTPRSGEQIIRDSDMSQERKNYWLGED